MKKMWSLKITTGPVIVKLMRLIKKRMIKKEGLKKNDKRMIKKEGLKKNDKRMIKKE